ncbi:putative nuclease HARBI1 [Photinus pyralis]|uniref:putative nuclease HARBI1 n=1 Tax=Photinus pyralis TaxID=7054 RepID=UPI001267690F|nr:putative nuclease HARBI1 [Photinus pyralis]
MSTNTRRCLCSSPVQKMASYNEEQFCVMAVAYALKKKQLHLQRKKRKARSKWVKEWLLKRNQFSHIHLLEELRLEVDDWRNYLRMDESCYVELLDLVTPLIEKQDTTMRPAISAHERLTATLRFLATGRNYADLKFTTIISPQSLGQIIPECCSAIYRVLCQKYLKFPSTEDEWLKIAEDFDKTTNFPNLLGAVDGKHVRIIPPRGSGSYFFNYKGEHSLVLMAVVNSNYEFIMIDFGVNGRISDGGVIEYTKFYDKLKNGTLCLPPPRSLKNTNHSFPFIFVGDEAFTLRPDFLKPFNQRELDHDKKIFNYRLSRARCRVENTFGIMSARFRIFHTAIGINLKAIERVVMACCVLHNFLRRKYASLYTPDNYCFD